MALPWFRMYGEAVDDVKLKLLAFEDRWHYVAILCCKSQGIIEVSQPLLDRRIAVKLGLQKSELDEVRRRLVEADLIDENWQPLNWAARQFSSDNAAERVKRHREKRIARGLPGQNWIPQEKRMKVFNRDSFRCVYCGSGENLTIDHATPQSRGGSDDINNLQTTCRACNASKRDLTHDEYCTRNGLVTLLKRNSNVVYTDSETDKETDGFNTLASNEKISFSPEEGFKNLNGYVDKWEAAYPAINVKNEIQKAAAWLQANPKNRKSNYARFLVNWFSRSQDKAGRTHESRKSIAERATDARKSYEAKFSKRFDDGEPVGEA